MTEYKNVSRKVMEELDKLAALGDTEAYNKKKEEHWIVDLYDLMKERNET